MKSTVNKKKVSSEAPTNSILKLNKVNLFYFTVLTESIFRTFFVLFIQDESLSKFLILKSFSSSSFRVINWFLSNVISTIAIEKIKNYFFTSKARLRSGFRYIYFLTIPLILLVPFSTWLGWCSFGLSNKRVRIANLIGSPFLFYLSYITFKIYYNGLFLLCLSVFTKCNDLLINHLAIHMVEGASNEQISKNRGQLLNIKQIINNLSKFLLVLIYMYKPPYFIYYYLKGEAVLGKIYYHISIVSLLGVVLSFIFESIKQLDELPYYGRNLTQAVIANTRNVGQGFKRLVWVGKGDFYERFFILVFLSYSHMIYSNIVLTKMRQIHVEVMQNNSLSVDLLNESMRRSLVNTLILGLILNSLYLLQNILGKYTKLKTRSYWNFLGFTYYLCLFIGLGLIHLDLLSIQKLLVLYSCSNFSLRTIYIKILLKADYSNQVLEMIIVSDSIIDALTTLIYQLMQIIGIPLYGYFFIGYSYTLFAFFIYRRFLNYSKVKDQLHLIDQDVVD